jgi:hypothetical protein
MTVSTQAQLPGGNALVLLPEAHYVTETETGLVFADDTPIDLWGGLVVRLQRQQKLIEWALADAINFGEAAYGEDHAQWVDETGLSKRTLQNIARIGRAIEPARRRVDISFSHHAEVVTLPVREQETLLDAAESAGWTRYDLRDAVRERRKELEGTAVDEPPVALPLSAADLTDEARQALSYRLAGLGQRHRTGYEAGFLGAILWLDAADCLKPGTREDR